jgi:hypothetical protein
MLTPPLRPPTPVRVCNRRSWQQRLPHATRTALGAAPAVVALALVGALVGDGVASARPPPRHGRTAPTPAFDLHEWGVWVVEPSGRQPHLADLARESPDFVFRADGAQAAAIGPTTTPVPLPGPRPPPPVDPPPNPPPPFWNGVGPPVARKPVVFFHAATSVDVTLDVAFPGGAPWLFFPHATLTRDATALQLRARIAPRASSALRPVPAGHFWNHLRAAGGDLVLSPDGTVDRFFFYDGPTSLRPSLRLAPAAHAPASPAPGGAAAVTAIPWPEVTGDGADVDGDVVYLIRGSAAGLELAELAHDASGTYAVRNVARGRAVLQQRLVREARARGLTAGEARALVHTWDDELTDGPAVRLVYFLRRDAYDHALPLTVTPAPRRTVRVGLVVVRGA